MSREQMACSITDGPQTPEEADAWLEPLEDEDAAYEEWRQIEIDAGAVNK